MNKFYNKVLDIAREYFGDQTNRFVDRQIIAHLSKTPESIEISDKEILAKWMRISSSLIFTDNRPQELYQKIISLE